MLVEPIKHSDYAALQIMTTYFEAIAKYKASYIKYGKSEHYFNEGVKDVFHDLAANPNCDAVLEMLYEQLRCGLYHTSTTGPMIILTRQTRTPISITLIDPSLDSGITYTKIIDIFINPSALLGRLKAHLAQLASQLRDTTNHELRANFEKRFDFECLIQLE